MYLVEQINKTRGCKNPLLKIYQMKIIQETDLFNFEFWSGAKDLADKLSYQELMEITDVL